VLPASEYGPTCTLPPHLSPFVDDSGIFDFLVFIVTPNLASGSYVPARRETLNKIKDAIANGKPYDIELHHEQAMAKKAAVEEAKNNEEDNNDDEEVEESDEEEEEITFKDDDEGKKNYFFFNLIFFFSTWNLLYF
jgi:hypothetical protein